MDTIKYIIKRLLLSVLILFGVSVIIYGLARMMPTDFVDQTFASQISQGTMKQEDVDRIKELYGLSMPDAYLSITIGEGSEFAGVKFQKNVKSATYEELVDLQQKGGNVDVMTGMFQQWYAGSFNTSDGKRIYLNDDGTYQIGTVISKGLSSEEVADDEVSYDEQETDNTIITLNEVFTEKEKGTYTIVEASGIYQIVLQNSSHEQISTGLNYRTASFWDKAGSLLKSYFGWLGNLLKGDLGMSFKYKRPVADVIFQNMGISFAIALVATILQFLIAIPLGIKAAVHQYGVVDYTVTVLAMMGISLPTFFLGAIVIRVFAVQLGWFEVGGIQSATLAMDASWFVRLGDTLWHMVLPMIVMVILSIGGLMRYTRTNTLEALNADYVRTARAKGLSEHAVIYKHAFRNTMIPIVTLLAGILPSLFSGAMITETVFSIPGVGKLAYDALIATDVPFIMGYNMFIAVLTVLGTLFSDLMYAVVDPRVKIGR